MDGHILACPKARHLFSDYYDVYESRNCPIFPGVNATLVLFTLHQTITFASSSGWDLE